MNWFWKKNKTISTNNEERAMNLLEISLRENEFNSFLYGVEGYCIDGRDSNGKNAPLLYYNRDAIYDYYRKNPDSNIKQKCETALLDELRKYDSDLIIHEALNVIETFLHAEKRAENNPFNMEFSTVFEMIETKIVNNKSKFCENNDEWAPFSNFYEFLLERSKYFNRKFGVTFNCEL